MSAPYSLSRPTGDGAACTHASLQQMCLVGACSLPLRTHWKRVAAAMVQETFQGGLKQCSLKFGKPMANGSPRPVHKDYTWRVGCPLRKHAICPGLCSRVAAGRGAKSPGLAGVHAVCLGGIAASRLAAFTELRQELGPGTAALYNQ